MSASKYAILGMLTIEPMTGYDLKKLTETALVHFWHESYGNLYPRLKRLAAAGLVEVREEARAGGPDAKVYSLTARGREAFEEWLGETPADEPVRSELLLKMFFGTQAPADVTEKHILDFQERHRARQAMFAAVEGRLRADEAANPSLPFWLMTLRRGQLTVEARLQWCEECLEVLRSGVCSAESGALQEGGAR